MSCVRFQGKRSRMGKSRAVLIFECAVKDGNPIRADAGSA